MKDEQLLAQYKSAKKLYAIILPIILVVIALFVFINCMTYPNRIWLYVGTGGGVAVLSTILIVVALVRLNKKIAFLESEGDK